MKIPGYTIMRELGSGGMATVYLARQDRLTRDVALKVMKPIAIAGDDFTSRFVKEGQIIAQLQHPQIVTIYDFDSSEGYHYFSMEYLPGGTLADEIRKGLPVQRAISITKKIAEALAVAHARGVIHRDVKPQNILFRSDGTPVLTDFGIARAVARGSDSMQLTSYGMVIGSPRYMSPEQSTGQQLDARSDLYSLGVVFYEMLTNQLPYEADDVVSLAMKHCNDPIPLLPQNLSTYQPILDSLIAKKPGDRFATAGQLIRALEALESATGSTEMDPEATLIVPRKETPTALNDQLPPPPPPPTERPKRGQRISLVLAVIASIALAGIYAARETILHPSAPDILLPLPPETQGRPETAKRYESLALEHFANHELEQGLEIVKLGLSTTPDDARLNTLKTLLLDHIAAQGHLTKARQLERENLLRDSLTEVESGLKRVADQPELMRLRENLLAQIDAVNQGKADILRDRAETDLNEGRLDQARTRIEEGLELSPTHSGLTALEKRLDEETARAEAIAESIRQAKKLLASGQVEASLDLVKRLLEETPKNPQLLDLQKTAEKQLEQLRRQRIAEIVRQVESLKARSAYDDGLSKLDEGLRLAPNDETLKTLRTEIQRLQEQERRDQADRLLAQARQLLEDEKLEKARNLVRQGLELVPEHAALKDLMNRIEKQLSITAATTTLLADCDRLFDAETSPSDPSQEMLECYAKAARSSPDDERIKSRLERIGEPLIAETQRKLNRFELETTEQLLAKLRLILAGDARVEDLDKRLQRVRALSPQMIRISGGCFQMGSPTTEPGREADEKVHDVCLRDFEIGRFEVSVEEFERFVQATRYRSDAEQGKGGTKGCFTLDQELESNQWRYQNWATWRKPNKYQETRPKDPVSCVSWNDAKAYLAWLSQETGGNFRLPTEAEWEYTARAGTTGMRYWGDEADERACHFANAADAGHKWDNGFPCNDQEEWVATVGSFQPNAWGLHDMLGNLWEWTCSEYDASYSGHEQSCASAKSDEPRIIRGGAWNSGQALVRAAYRNRNYPEGRNSFLGFRPLLELPEPETPGRGKDLE